MNPRAPWRPAVLLLLLAAWSSPAAAVPFDKVVDPMATRGSHVGDQAGMLRPDELARVDEIARAIRAENGAELAVMIVDSLEGITVEDYAERLFSRLGFGQKGKDNGVLLLISKGDRKSRIETGYGVEAVLTDAMCKRILDDLGMPLFKQQRYGEGVALMAQAIRQLLAGGSLPSAPPAPTGAVAPSDESVPEARSDESASVTDEEPSAKRGTSVGPDRLYSSVVALGCFALASLGMLFRPALRSKRRWLLGATIPVALPWLDGGLRWGLADWSFAAAAPTFLLALGMSTLVFLFRQPLGAYLTRYRRRCKSCRKDMRLLTEEEDDQYLSTEEIAEERARGYDYELWRCDECKLNERFDIKCYGASKCRKCSRRTMHSSSHVISAATTVSTGLRQHDEDCKNPPCGYHRTWTTVIPRVSKSSSSGSSSSGGRSSWGGGRSGGGGASGSW